MNRLLAVACLAVTMSADAAAAGIDDAHMEVWRVSGCNGPGRAIDARWVRFCDVRQEATNKGTPCGDSRGNRIRLLATAGRGLARELADEIDDEDLPEWDTMAVAGGIGMYGVIPAQCIVTGEQFLRTPEGGQMRSVAVLRNRKGRTIGTATLIAPRLLLTAFHVACPREIPHGGIVNVAVFDFNYSDAGPTVVENQRDFILASVPTHTGSWKLRIVGGSAVMGLDYALLQIEEREGTRLADLGIKPLSIAGYERLPLPGERVHLLGHTDNPFYPRGLTLSTHGVVKQLWKETDFPTSLEYNLTTASGFSGGPVFNDRFEWIGVHTRTHTKDEVKYGKAWRDFSLPNGGHQLRYVLRHIAQAHSRKWLKENFGAGDTLETLLALRSDRTEVRSDECPY